MHYEKHQYIISHTKNTTTHRNNNFTQPNIEQLLQILVSQFDKMPRNKKIQL